MKQSTVLNKIKDKNLDGLRYAKRSHYFTNYKNSCGFNPDTFFGHSYNWYRLTDKIDGVLVLNSYVYSNQTAKHISKMRRLFSILGLKYKEISAPKGLQNLDAALEYNLLELARIELKIKHQRGPVKYDFGIKQINKAIDLLIRFGKIPSQAAVKRAQVAAAEEREERLNRQRVKRELNKQREEKIPHLVLSAAVPNE